MKEKDNEGGGKKEGVCEGENMEERACEEILKGSH